MPRKIARPDADVQRLADQLRVRWVPADGIDPWLRRNVVKLSRMVRDQSWSWTDIGKAMTLAGIVYQSGRPWTGHLLTTKAAQARNQIRLRKAAAEAKIASSAVATAVAPPRLIPVPARQEEPPPVDDGEFTVAHRQKAPPATPATGPEDDAPPPDKPRFGFATLRNHTPSPAPKPQPHPKPEPAKQDADAVVRRLLGSKASKVLPPDHDDE